MSLHVKSPGHAPGVYPIVRRGEKLKYLSFTIIQLGGELTSYMVESGADELSLDFYSGPVRVEVEDASGRWSAEIPTRSSIREPGPMVYIPAGSQVTLTRLNGDARITVAAAEGKPGGSPALIRADDAALNHVGKDNWTRTVYTHIANNIDAARLIAGETVNQPGGWSSCPPHKHDRFAPPSEVPMDGDTVLIPRGYHPVVACPGYALNYTWVLAGEGRTYGAWSDDPQHAWIKQT
jgi:5-deoxy-glucuronate isomerase